MPTLISAAALAHVFPEGQKITGFKLKYDCEPDPALLSADSFTVTDSSLVPDLPAAKVTILSVHADGCQVTLETDTKEKSAWAIMNYTHDGRPNPLAPPLNRDKPVKNGSPKGSRKALGEPDPKKMGYTGSKPLHIEVSQMTELKTMDGQAIPPCRTVCEQLDCPETARFKLCQYKDLPYQLYIPADYSSDRSYPLVLFIPDASARCTDPDIPLRQGIGGVVWTSPEDQSKHPCFVVCPVFRPEELLTHDDFTCLPRLYTVKDLLDDVTAHYNIDTDRIYTTGQSMGCMSSCELMCTYPDYFAGAVLVAGQWDPARCGKTMADKNLWILVSENDLKAHPGMDAVTSAIEENGGTVKRLLWDGSAPAELDEQVHEALKTPANVYYTLFQGSTVVPPDEDANPGSNHMCTWRAAYQISALRDWLFTVRRSGRGAI